MIKRTSSLLIAGITASSLFALSSAQLRAEEKISFNEKIRPLLNRSCVGCHGGVKKAGEVSFIYREEALGKGESGRSVIVPGKPEESELYKRIISKDPDIMMPIPGDHGKPLAKAEIALLKKWIEQGASWEEHWSYIKPKKHEAKVKDTKWARQPVDNFILQKIESLGLKPSPEADKAQWQRRASFDITGLPPSPAELEAFQSNTAEDAYEKEVDRMLASPRYGERWASLWMDLARYADTQGYEKDPHRDIWLYREWLIKSFNKDMSYDEFLRDQLAGDLVQNPTTDQLIATAFQRNTQTNTEGGTDDEEFRVTSVIDRVNTTWASLQGITFGCTQCHSHPYEPIEHEEYYKFSSFYNNSEDADLDNDFPKLLIAHDPKLRDKASTLQLQQIELKNKKNEIGRKLMYDDKSWGKLDYIEIKSSAGKIFEKDGVIQTSGTHPVRLNHQLNAKVRSFTALKFSIIPEESDPAKLPERGQVLSHYIMEKISADGSKQNIPFNMVFADSLVGPYSPSQSLQGGAAGFGGYPKLFKQRDVVYVPNSPVTVEEGDSFQIAIHCAASTTGNQAATVRKFQIYTSNDPAWTKLRIDPAYVKVSQELARSQVELKSIKGSHIPVMRERTDENVRETRMFIGGLWLNKGEVQQPGVPKVLNSYKAKAGNRLEMANWMTSAENPLTSRVMANRVFSELFGRGIVETLGDFGSSGIKPTNLPLLDNLALSLQNDHQWKLKGFIKELILSAAYRQDNRATAKLAHDDPKNIWLARGPKTRLTAEMVRDNALAVSGLVQHKLGGKSVMPPQPDGVWQSVYSGASWKNATGPDRYRRSIYTYWKRTSPYPSMMTFDAPSRDICVTQRIATNTPLQALVTLNDPVFLECSQKFAEVISNTPGTLEGKLAYAYKLSTQQESNKLITKTLAELYQKLSVDYKTQDHSKIAVTAEQAAMVIVANALLNLDSAITK